MSQFGDNLREMVPDGWSVVEAGGAYVFVAPDKRTRYVLTSDYQGGDYAWTLTALTYEADGAVGHQADDWFGVGYDTLATDIIPRVEEMHDAVYEP